MSGGMSFKEALRLRLNLIKPTLNQVLLLSMILCLFCVCFVSFSEQYYHGSIHTIYVHCMTFVSVHYEVLCTVVIHKCTSYV